ncbi:hypothetical protein LCGC14_1621970, partial [marine sediment metagenome]
MSIHKFIPDWKLREKFRKERQDEVNFSYRPSGGKMSRIDNTENLHTNYLKEMTKMREFESGATRDDEEGKRDFEGFLSPLALQRYAQYMHKHRKQADGKLRDSDNWQKGIPLSVYMKSWWRHFMDTWYMWRGTHREEFGVIELKDWDDNCLDEISDLLCAALFNNMG